MYKVFIYDKPVFITSDAKMLVKNCQQLEGLNVDKIISELESDDIGGLIVLVKNENKSWKKLSSYFENIDAAGGIVYNENGKMLFIHRLGKWDLPKGKREKGEEIERCAKREIEEECQVNQLNIIRSLPSTYHCYFYKGSWVMKKTYWYEMKTTYKGKLVPQKEEGIEKVEWLGIKDLDQVYNNTYLSIKEVLKNSI